jgi:hypothetical protein
MELLDAYEFTLAHVKELMEKGTQIRMEIPFLAKDKKVIEASKKEGGIPSDKWVRICFQNLDETRKYKVLEAENFLSLFGISFDCGGCLNEREWEIDWSFRYDKGEEKMGWMISRDKMVDNNNKPN